MAHQEIKSQNIDVGGIPVQVASYTDQKADGKLSTVSATIYKDRDFDFTGDDKQKQALENAVKGSAQQSGSEVISTELTEFLGNKAIKAELLAKKGGQEAKIYSLYLLKKVEQTPESTPGTTLYAITTINKDKDAFDKLVSSFKLN